MNAAIPSPLPVGVRPGSPEAADRGAADDDEAASTPASGRREIEAAAEQGASGGSRRLLDTLDALAQPEPRDLSRWLAAWARYFVELRAEEAAMREARRPSTRARLENHRRLAEAYAHVVKAYARHGDDARVVDAFRAFLGDVTRHEREPDARLAVRPGAPPLRRR